MPLVEFVGPPAVGKSALLDECVRRGGVDARRSVLGPRHTALAPLTGWARAAPIRPRLLRTVADRVLVGPSDAQVEAALAAVAPRWDAFLRLILESTPSVAGHSSAELVLALVGRGWSIDATRLRAVLEERRTGTSTLLLDEGLTHPYKAHAAVGSDDAALERYAAVVPLPDVLVVLACDRHHLAERLAGRARATPHRARWSVGAPADQPEAFLAEADRTAQMVERIAAGAVARGCRVVRLSTSATSPSDNAATLMDALRSSPDPAGERR